MLKLKKLLISLFDHLRGERAWNHHREMPPVINRQDGSGRGGSFWIFHKSRWNIQNKKTTWRIPHRQQIPQMALPDIFTDFRLWGVCVVGRERPVRSKHYCRTSRPHHLGNYVRACGLQTHAFANWRTKKTNKANTPSRGEPSSAWQPSRVFRE